MRERTCQAGEGGGSAAKEAKEGLITKTSLMLGLGETEDQLWDALKGKKWLLQFGPEEKC